MSFLTTIGNLPGPVAAVMRHVYTGLGVGTMVLVAVGVSQGETTALGNAVHQIGDGIVAVVSGIAAIAAIVSPYLAAWSATNASRKSAVGAIPNTMVVTTAPTTSQVTDTHQTAMLAAKIATIPEVQNVISTPEIAAGTVSNKVVSGTTAPATP